MENTEYRILNNGEILQEDDEFLGTSVNGPTWWKTCVSGMKVGSEDIAHFQYRRKVTGVPIEKQLADTGEVFAKLEAKHSEVVNELSNLRARIQEVSSENKKLQKGINNRNEEIADLKFIIRELRKKNS